METFELGAGAQALPRPQRAASAAYPSTVQEIRFFTVARARVPPRPLQALARRPALLAHRQLLHPRAAPALPLRHRARGAGRRHRRGSTAASSTPTPTCYDNDARFVWNFVRAALDYGCVAANYVSRSERPSARASCGRRARATASPARELRHPLARPDQRLRSVGRRDERARRGAHGAPPRLLQGHPPHRRPADDEQARAHVLRRRRAPLLRHPHGPAHLHRHHRHARRPPRRGGDAPRTAASSSTTSTSGCACRAAHRGRHRRRALRRAAAGGGRRRGPRSARLDAALAQARHRGRRRSAGTSASSAASSPTASTWARRSATAVRGLGVELPFAERRLVRRAARRGARRVLPPGAADGPGRADRAAGRREKLTTRLWRRYGGRGAGRCSRTSAPTRARPRCSSRAPSTSAASWTRRRAARWS